MTPSASRDKPPPRRPGHLDITPGVPHRLPNFSPILDEGRCTGPGRTVPVGASRRRGNSSPHSDRQIASDDGHLKKDESPPRSQERTRLRQPDDVDMSDRTLRAHAPGFENEELEP